MKTRLLSLLGISKKQLLILAVAASVTFSGVYVFTSSAACYSGTMFGRACWRGYFSNTLDQYGDNVLPVVKNGQALPTSDVYNVDTLYGTLRAAYFSGNAQRRTGAAFIYNTMMANNAPGVGRNVSEAQWAKLYTDLKGLENAGKISWFGNVTATTNSYWQGPNTDDDAYYGEFKNEPGILIRDYNDNIIYRLLRRCANPIGAAFKLPDAQNYTLTPNVNSISPTESQSIESDGKMSAQTRVTNVGNASSKPTQWEITLITVQPGKRAPHEDEGNVTFSGVAPCQTGGGGPLGNYFQNGDATCKNVSKGSQVFNLNTTALNVNNIPIGDVPVGTRMCFTLSVQPRSNSDNSWAHAKPRCTVVGKKPKVQIWGGDIAVRGKIETSTSVKTIDGSAKTFGSWVEYGAFSVGVNSRFASGAGLVDQTNNEQTAWSNLTFANKDDSGADAFGQYAPTLRTLPSIASFFGTIQNKQPILGASTDIGSLAFANGGPIVVRTAGNLLITGGTVPAKQSVVIISTGTVTIDNSITYDDASITSVQDIPQTVIIAQNINISGKAKQVDAWLVASGSINTCHDFTGNLTSTKCADRLEVNGPVVTNKLILNRTAGSNPGAESGDPGERFNLRPDAHLWALMQSRGSNKAQTVYSVELPPRF